MSRDRYRSHSHRSSGDVFAKLRGLWQNAHAHKSHLVLAEDNKQLDLRIASLLEKLMACKTEMDVENLLRAAPKSALLPLSEELASLLEKAGTLLTAKPKTPPSAPSGASTKPKTYKSQRSLEQFCGTASEKVGPPQYLQKAPPSGSAGQTSTKPLNAPTVAENLDLHQIRAITVAARDLAADFHSKYGPAAYKNPCTGSYSRLTPVLFVEESGAVSAQRGYHQDHHAVLSGCGRFPVDNVTLLLCELFPAFISMPRRFLISERMFGQNICLLKHQLGGASAVKDLHLRVSPEPPSPLSLAKMAEKKDDKSCVAEGSAKKKARFDSVSCTKEADNATQSGRKCIERRVSDAKCCENQQRKPEIGGAMQQCAPPSKAVAAQNGSNIKRKREEMLKMSCMDIFIKSKKY